MSEATQEAYPDNQGAGQQQQQEIAPSNQPDQTTSPKQTGAQKRKRESIDNGEKEEGRDGVEGGANSRRTSFKQSPSMTNTTTFMPINPNAPQPDQQQQQQQQQPQQQYAFQPLNVAPQQPQQNLNGAATSASQNTANAALAAQAMNGLLPQLQASQQPMGDYAQQDPRAPKPTDQVPQMPPTGFQMQQQPMDGQPQGVAATPTRQSSAPTGRSNSVSQPNATPNPKPQVGTEEWHRVRRDNHKEVERRRRETINEGINELAKIVPGCEKNKGSILQRAVQYIQEIKEAEAQNIEKWTLEKLLTEQAIQELSQTNEKLKKELERAWREAETWKQSCLQAREGGGQSGPSS